jgi:peptidyl carrier protein
MTEAEISTLLLDFIRERFLDDDPASDLNERTPLLEWGVLNSMNTAQLLGFIREELGYDVPPASVNARNFRNVGAITAMLTDGLVEGKA